MDSSIMRLNPVSGRDMCKILERIGFQKIHQKGSHARYARHDGCMTVVPVHGNEMLGGGLIHEIITQAGISREEYEKLRRRT